MRFKLAILIRTYTVDSSSRDPITRGCKLAGCNYCTTRILSAMVTRLHSVCPSLENRQVAGEMVFQMNKRIASRVIPI
jgi:hypothetical protein